MPFWCQLESLQALKPLKNQQFSYVFTMSAKCHPGPLWMSFGRPRHPQIDPMGSKMNQRDPQGAPETPQMEPKGIKVDPKVPQDSQSDPEGLHSIQKACQSDPKCFTSEPKRFKSELPRASKITPRALKMTQQVLQETPTSQQRTTNLSSACR